MIFLIRSGTIKLTNYTIKNIPGSSGRLDVISRCILSALLKHDNFHKNMQIWIFLDSYGTFIFDSELLDYQNFPKNELKLTNYFVELIKNKNQLEKIPENPLINVKVSNVLIFDVIKNFLKKGFSAVILEEGGQNFFKQIENFEKENIVFIIGNQTGDFLDSDEFEILNLPKITFGTTSYLASSIIRLIILYLKSNK